MLGGISWNVCMCDRVLLKGRQGMFRMYIRLIYAVTVRTLLWHETSLQPPPCRQCLDLTAIATTPTHLPTPTRYGMHGIKKTHKIYPSRPPGSP